jgi:hypothetical protein
MDTEAEPLLIEAYEQMLAEAVAELRQLPRTKDARMGQTLLFYGACLS